VPEDEAEHLTELARFFLEPSNSTHRQYEALRAYYVDGLPSREVARRFGYTAGSFRVLCHQFRQDPRRPFFLTPRKGPRHSLEKDVRREQIIAWRKQNLSVYDISDALVEAGRPLSPAAVSLILKEEGFAPLPRRRDEERPPKPRPAAAAVADVRRLDLTPRQFHTKFGGLFLFLPDLARIPLSRILEQAGFPGTEMVPAEGAWRALLALKLFGNARNSHVMSYVFDEGPALFAGLNCLPKRSFLTEYSCRIDPAAYPRIRRLWFEAVHRRGLARGDSFDLDFHTIPFHGQQALLQKHYVSRRSRRQKGVLAFLAADADSRVFCYANSEVRQEDQNDEILRFVEDWKERTGELPRELIFDSKLTVYANLNRLNQMGIDFMTLRRRSRRMLEEVRQQPLSAWRRLHLQRVTRAFRTPRVLDQRIQLNHYQGPLRQLIVDELGHEQPTFLLTNQLRRSPTTLVERYAQRMLIENQIADSIDFFHMDALSSAIPMKINCDLQLTLMAGSLYRLLGARIGNGYAQAKSRHLFRDFIDAVAQVTLTRREIQVRFQKRAHNPLLLAAGYAKLNPVIPWLGGKRLRLFFGEPN
jgi:transposase